MTTTTTTATANINIPTPAEVYLSQGERALARGTHYIGRNRSGSTRCATGTASIGGCWIQ